MIPFHNAMSIASEGGKTYADWLTHIATRSGTAPLAETAQIQSFSTSAGTYLRRVQMASGTASGALYGSPFANTELGGIMGLGSVLVRVVQQALPDQSQFNAQRAAARILLVEVNVVTNGSEGSPSIPGATRNGLTSSGFTWSPETQIWQIGGGSNGSPTEGARVGASYWDDALDAAMSYFPRNRSGGGGYGPFPYVAAGW